MNHGYEYAYDQYDQGTESVIVYQKCQQSVFLSIDTVIEGAGEIGPRDTYGSCICPRCREL